MLGIARQLLAVALVILVACNDDALNEFGAEGAHRTMLTIELHDAWIASPQATAGGPDGTATQVPIQLHNDVTLHVVNRGAEPHAFALYHDRAGTELLVRSSMLAPGAFETLSYHFHDPQVAYFFDDAHRDEMRGELHVLE